MSTGEQAARREAVAVSGWGARFRLLQPRNACFWIYVPAVAVGIWHVVQSVEPTAGLFAEANLVAVISSGLFAAVFLLFLRHAGRWERTPAALAVAAFLGGGFASTFAMAIAGNAALMSLYTKLFGQPWALDWKAGLTAPFVEETAKGAVFVLLLGLAPVVIRTAYDGLIVGAYTGLGFQVVEDMLYGQNAAARAFGANQAHNVLDTFALRAISGIASHALCTALFAAGVIYLIGTVAQPRHVVRGLLLMLSAMVIHGVWDSAAALGRGGPLSALILLLTTILAIVLLFVALHLGAARERAFMRAIMTPEVTNGTLTAAELDAVVGGRKDRRAAARADGMSRRREKHVVTAARDLAHGLATADGTETDDVRHSRSELTRLRSR